MTGSRPDRESAVTGRHPQGRVAFVMGTATGGTVAHVRMLAAGLAARGVAVCVFAPAGAPGLAPLPGVDFAPVEFGDRPRPGDLSALLRLRRLLPPRAAVVHAHGLRAGALAALALAGVARARRPALVVTVHNAPPASGGARALIYRVLELIVARRAELVLCVSGDLEQRLHAAGARRVGRAVVPAPAASAPAEPNPADAAADGRPVVLAVGRLAAQKGFGLLLRAAADWHDMNPRPLIVIAGDGPLDAELRRQARSLGVDAAFLGRRDDVPALLTVASVFVLPSVWEGQPLVLQEALRAGVPVVASRVGGIPDLTGDAAALLVPPRDSRALAAAVRRVLEDPALAGRLRAAARERAARLPGEDDAVAAALDYYAQVLPAPG